MKDIVSEELGMTLEQMEDEIVLMREWDNFIRQTMGDDDYDFLCTEFAKMRTAKDMKSLGMLDSEIKEFMESMGYNDVIVG